MADFFGILKKIAPFVSMGLKLGGPAGALASAAIDSVTSQKVATTDDLSAAFANSPDQRKFIADLKAAEQNFSLQMKQLEISSVEELEKLATEDRASARTREMTVRDRIPAILAIGITIGFFAVLFFAFSHGVKPESKEMADIMVGSLGTAWVSVVAYYFGSSRGSDRKTELLAGGQPDTGSAR